MSLVDISIDNWNDISSFLEIKDLYNTCRVCKCLHEININKLDPTIDRYKGFMNSIHHPISMEYILGKWHIRSYFAWNLLNSCYDKDGKSFPLILKIITDENLTRMFDMRLKSKRCKHHMIKHLADEINLRKLTITFTAKKIRFANLITNKILRYVHPTWFTSSSMFYEYLTEFKDCYRCPFENFKQLEYELSVEVVKFICENFTETSDNVKRLSQSDYLSENAKLYLASLDYTLYARFDIPLPISILDMNAPKNVICHVIHHHLNKDDPAQADFIKHRYDIPSYMIMEGRPKNYDINRKLYKSLGYMFNLYMEQCFNCSVWNHCGISGEESMFDNLLYVSYLSEEAQQVINDTIDTFIVTHHHEYLQTFKECIRYNLKWRIR
ncbi:hypothetical protein D3C87_940190 [compost metagenome]